MVHCFWQVFYFCCLLVFVSFPLFCPIYDYFIRILNLGDAKTRRKNIEGALTFILYVMRLSFFQIKSKIYFKEISMFNFFVKICGAAMKNITIMFVEKENIFRVEKSHIVDEWTRARNLFKWNRIYHSRTFFAMMRGINFACLSIDYITFLFLFTNFTCMKLKS